jgi:endonuclease III-like uncharacterized protein
LQLRAIEKTLRQMERNGIPAPEGLISEKVSIENKMEKFEKAPRDISLIYKELIEIIIQIGRIIKRHPSKDMRNLLKEWKEATTPKGILRETIITVLKEMGGSGQEQEILKCVGDKLKGELRPADFYRPLGKRSRLEINLRNERKRMVKDGILTPESKRRKWTLM